MEVRSDFTERERAHHRVLGCYQHLFPGLVGALEGEGRKLPLQEEEEHDGEQSKSAGRGYLGYPLWLQPLEAAPTVALSPEFELSPEVVKKGWLSQPQEFDYELDIEGLLPSELSGTLFRNGPGLLEVYGVPLVHPIDGDGMVCSITISNGRAHFRSKYVKTTGYVMEKKAKKLLFKGMMGTKPPLNWNESLSEWSEDVMKSKLPGQRFKNPSNTNIYFWGGKLLSTWESGLPYSLDPATLETHGKETLGGVLKESRCLAAHFRYDPSTDRLVTFSFQLYMSGQCKLFIYEFDRQWELLSNQVHSLEKFYYCHDFMLTENYYIFHQTPFYKISKANVAKIISGVSAPGKLMRFYPDLPSKMILIPRDGKSQLRFFDVEPCMIYHHCNAWEEGDKVYFSSVCIGEKFNMDFDQGIWLSNASVEPGVLFNFTLDLTNNTLARVRADLCSCEFPGMHPARAGKKWRYAYLMASESPQKLIPYQEIVKFDREGHGRQVWSAREEFGTLGEPVFVPRPGPERDEDDGWVVSQLYDCKHHQTQFIVLDAKDLARGPVARLKLRHHTPYGFHGTFTPEVFH